MHKNPYFFLVNCLYIMIGPTENLIWPRTGHDRRRIGVVNTRLSKSFIL